MYKNNKIRQAAFAVVVCAVGAAALAPQSAQAQDRRVRGGRQAQVSPLMNSNILVFPPVITGANGDAVTELTKNQRDVMDIVSDAVRHQMVQSGLGTFVYNRRLPSIQRAISEGLKAEDAAMGPGDNDAKAQQYASLAGATEFVTITIEDYRYDAPTRTAVFNVSLTRAATVDGVKLGTVAEKAIGVAPTDVAGPRQEGSAAARAAEVVAEQVVVGLYPETKVVVETNKKARGGKPKKTEAVMQTDKPVANPVDKPAGAAVRPPAPVPLRPNSAPATSATPASPATPTPPTNPRPRPGQPATAPPSGNSAPAPPATPGSIPGGPTTGPVVTPAGPTGPVVVPVVPVVPVTPPTTTPPTTTPSANPNP